MERKSPLDVTKIKQKIDNGQVKVKASKSTAKKNTNKAHSVTGVNGKISDTEIMAWLKAQDKAVTSTQLRDGLAFKTRTQARRVLRRLAKRGVVKIKTKQLTEKRKVYTYTA